MQAACQRKDRANPFDSTAEAEDYRRWWASPLGETVFRIEVATLERLLPLRPPARILDLGCGTGEFSIDLAARGFDVAGLDAARPMLDVARQEADRRGVHVTWIQGAMESLPFGVGTLDGVLQIASLEFATDPGAALREVARVLRPGGVYVLGLVSHQSLFGLLKPSRRRLIKTLSVRSLAPDLGAFQLERTAQDIFIPPLNIPSIRAWGPVFERAGACCGVGGARRNYLFRRRPD